MSLLVRWRRNWVYGCESRILDQSGQLLDDNAEKFKIFLFQSIMVASTGDNALIQNVTKELWKTFVRHSANNETPQNLIGIADRMDRLFPGVNDADFLIINAINVSPTGSVFMKSLPDGGFDSKYNEETVKGIGPGGDAAVMHYNNLAGQTPPQTKEEVGNLIAAAILEACRDNSDIGGTIRVRFTENGSWRVHI